MSFILQQIPYQENRRIANIRRLLCEQRAIGVFGGGGYAHTLITELRRYGIDVSFCVVDDAFFRENEDCCGVHILSVRQCNRNCTGSIVLFGFGVTYAEEENAVGRVRKELDKSIELLNLEDQFPYSFYAFDYSQFLLYHERYQFLYDSLSDEESRRLLVAYLQGKVSGNFHQMREFQSLKKECYSWDLLQQRVSAGVVIDCGAFDGVSSVQACRSLPSNVKVLALESNRENYSLLCKNTADYPQIETICKGVWKESGVRCLHGCGDTSSLTDESAPDAEAIEVVAIDQLSTGERVSAIVMDIEGAEREALDGARKTIEKEHPALAIRLYHRQSDFTVIPELLSQLDSRETPYRYYLRYNCQYRGAADFTLYAV